MNSGGHMTILDAGDKVTGTYVGHRFEGTITERRPHTMNDQWIYHVALHSPITVFGAVRSSVAVYVPSEGDSIRIQE
jgi:hypothetical protein